MISSRYIIPHSWGIHVYVSLYSQQRALTFHMSINKSSQWEKTYRLPKLSLLCNLEKDEARNTIIEIPGLIIVKCRIFMNMLQQINLTVINIKSHLVYYPLYYVNNYQSYKLMSQDISKRACVKSVFRFPGRFRQMPCLFKGYRHLK